MSHFIVIYFQKGKAHIEEKSKKYFLYNFGTKVRTVAVSLYCQG